MPNPRLRLGQLLVDARLITQDQLDEALEEQRSDGRRLGTLLVVHGLINETQLTQILSHQLAVPWVSLLHIEFSRQLLNLVPREVVDQFCVLPIYVRHVRGQGDTLYVAMDDPTNEEALAACSLSSGLPVRAMIAPPTDIRSAIRVYYGGARGGTDSLRGDVMVDAMPSSRTSDVDSSAAWAPPRSDRAPRSRKSVAPPAEERAAGPSKPPPPEIAPPPATPEIQPPPATPEIQPPPDKPDVEHAPTGPEVGPPPDKPEIAPPSPSPEITPPEPQPKPEAVAQAAAPSSRSKPRMVSLTLLDGTTITLPARGRPKPEEPKQEVAVPAIDDDTQLTARDLVAALRAVAHGADATEILGEARWETLFAALLSLLLKKQLIADWEFVDEFKRI